jgi:hypothetical protein
MQNLSSGFENAECKMQNAELEIIPIFRKENKPK